MAGVQFAFSPLLAELTEISNFAYKFVRHDRAASILDSRQLLQDIQDGGTVGQEYEWVLPPNEAIGTIPVEGVFQPDSGRVGNVWATLSFDWLITPREQDPNGGKTLFEITGGASTLIRILTDADGGETQLAMWRMEIDTDQGPGATFHIRVMGENADGQFPNSLAVPRLPIFPTTPASALEFVIAELFQETWSQHLALRSQQLHRWREIQSSRLRSYYDWRLSILRESHGSPITNLKSNFPRPDQFLYL